MNESTPTDLRSGWFTVRRIGGNTIMQGGTEEEQNAVKAKINNRKPLINVVAPIQTAADQKIETHTPSKNINIRLETQTAVKNEISDEGLSPIQRLLKWFTRFSQEL